MYELMLFKNDEFGELRVLKKDDCLYFVAEDIFTALNDVWDNTFISSIPHEWKLIIKNNKVDDLCLTEHGLYFFLGRWDNPSVLNLHKWIATDVLPRIRTKEGIMPDFTNPASVARAWAALYEKSQFLEQELDKLSLEKGLKS